MVSGKTRKTLEKVFMSHEVDPAGSSQSNWNKKGMGFYDTEFMGNIAGAVTECKGKSHKESKAVESEEVDNSLKEIILKNNNAANVQSL